MFEYSKDYKTYLKSFQWRLKCTIYWDAFGKFCQACKTTKGPLQVHHMSYEHFRNEPLSDLMGLCYDCHREVHRLHRQLGRKVSLREVTLKYQQDKRLEILRSTRP